MAEIQVKIKQKINDVVNISFDVRPKVAFAIIKQLDKDHSIHCRIDAEGMSVNSLLILCTNIKNNLKPKS